MKIVERRWRQYAASEKNMGVILSRKKLTEVSDGSLKGYADEDYFLYHVITDSGGNVELLLKGKEKKFVAAFDCETAAKNAVIGWECDDEDGNLWKIKDEDRCNPYPYRIEELEALLRSVVNYETDLENRESTENARETLKEMGFSEEQMRYFGLPEIIE